MDSEDYFDQVFSRANILKSKPPTKSARTLLFQIETRAAYLAAKARQATALYVTEETAEEQQMRYFNAYNAGQDPPRPAAIQDLERFANRWQELVPSNPALQAAVAHHLGQKYTFSAAAVPQIRQALSLDTEAVKTAYFRFYEQDLQTIYSERQSFLERVRWSWCSLGQKLENLPLFWWVFSLTITEIVGASVLALPIALAGIGPIPGIVLLIIFGLVNVLTVGYMAETASRSAGIRTGNAFLGQVVNDYLGRFASIILSLGLLALLLLVLLAFYIGFATTIADPTGIPAPVWVLILFLAGLFFVSRGSLSSTITSALVVGAINLGILLVLVILTLPHVQIQYLTYTNLPFISGRPFDSSILALVFGVIFAAYFGHLSVPNSARVVLQRDHSGKSLVRGAMAAQVVVILVNSIWILIINGSLAPETLANVSGTVLIPLAAEVGSIVFPFGTVFVILGMGMITIHFSLGLFNFTREWLPLREKPTVSLLRRQGRLLFYPSGKKTKLPQISLVYLGMRENSPWMRLDLQTEAGTSRFERPIGHTWEFSSLLAAHPELQRQDNDLTLRIEVVSADNQGAQIRANSSQAMIFEPGWDSAGLQMSSILSLPDEEAELLIWMIREGPIELQTAADLLGQQPDVTKATLNKLMSIGFIQEMGEGQYEAILAASRHRVFSDEINVFVSDQKAEATTGETRSNHHSSPSFTSRMLDKLFSKRGRFLLGILPITIVFLAAQISLFSGSESFAGPLGFIGVIVIAMLGGIYPVLLLSSGRNKGEVVPQFIYRIIGHPAFLIFIYVVSLTGIILHGLFIWQDIIQRVLALIVAAVIVAVTFDGWRRGAFRPRLVIELHRDSKKELHFSVVAGGRPLPIDVQWTHENGKERKESKDRGSIDFAGLKSISFRLPKNPVQSLKIWAFQETSAGDYEILPATAELDQDGSVESIDLALSGGERQWTLNGLPGYLTLTFQNN